MDDSLRAIEEELLEALGWRRLNAWWAKGEIVLGLVAVGLGHYWLLHGTEVNLIVWALMLFVLGGYLALAGHRSHLYQSNTKLAAVLLQAFRQRR